MQKPESRAPAVSPLPGEAALRAIQAQARYIFRPVEFGRLTGNEVGGEALKSALARHSKRGRIALVSKRPTAWLIVPPEHEHYGAPPVGWWLHDYLKDTEPHYYLALLSAARHWGSGHDALQATQVMVGSQRASQTIGRLRLDYTCKKNIDKTPVVLVSTTVARMRVSTREATLLDLIRHQTEIGGLEAIVRIAHDFAPALAASNLVQALDALDQTRAAQRLGFVFEKLLLSEMAAAVEVWLQKRRRTLQPLEVGDSSEPSELVTDPRWSVTYTPEQLEIFEEIA